MQTILSTNQLYKRYLDKNVISDVNLNVQQGEIYGFLGPNGAGKTTIMKMITGLIRPTSGQITLFNQPSTTSSFEIRKRIGSLIEYPIFYEHLSAYENLQLHCEYMGFYDHKAITDALELTSITEPRMKPVKHFSLGMKQRLGIARAICTRPELLLLDEPINGMDPVGIRELRELFHALSKEHGMTLFISSHILQEIEHLADTIGVIKEGRLLKELSMSQIHSQHRDYIEVALTDSKKAVAVIERKLNITNFKVIDPHLIHIYEPNVSSIELSKCLILNGIGIESLNKKHVSLEDYFLQIIQGGAVSD
ncbi:ABC-2 type transport system ATP-binding protein [Seinonella peptonophila]|uniref:ABC-2 type transport system ATP-binding protein n=1 Tax=Seinonella peptonophila TaxID=112248 RepID=A0A1M4U1B8_9BACL|nr:ATP-binding cassette domain-containing protein [Seinonella peptonophila]SHE50460.1 ABC-2 type transport system ATP-binding protein [Seinonella peptonophila]